MNIGDIYNSIGQVAQKATGSLSSMLASKPITYERPQEPKPVIPTKYVLKDRGAEVSDEDLQKIRPLIYGEVSNRDYNKKAMEADIIFNTALNRQREYNARGKNLSVSDIVAMPNQYQAYGGNQYNTYYNPKNPIDLAKKKEVDTIVDNIADRVKKGQYADNTQGAHYYIHHPDGRIEYDNIKKLFK